MSGRHSAPEEPVALYELQEIDEDRPRADPVASGSGSHRRPEETAPQLDEPAPDRRLAAEGLAAQEVSYRRAGRDILLGVSIEARPGEIVGLVGPSGSGKSSLVALLAGLEQPDSGVVRRARRDDGTPARQGLILQGYGLVSVLTAAENVEVALQSGAAGKMTSAEIGARAARYLHVVGLSAVADHLVEELSGGQQQRVAVARALAVHPDVLFADELTAELDHEWKQRIVDAVFSVAQEGGIVVVATHDPEIAERCDRMVTITDGRLS